MTNIDWNILTRWLLPVRLRKPFLLAWLKALTAPIWQTLYPLFKAFEAKAWYDLKYQSGQVAHLEFVLNERFDPAQKRIWIGPGSATDKRVYLYLDAENQTKYLFKDVEDSPVYLYQESELSGSGVYDFSINVPAGLPMEEAALRAVADRYKRDSKDYIINYF